MLAQSREDLLKFGFKWGHALQLFQYFNKQASNDEGKITTSSPPAKGSNSGKAVGATHVEPNSKFAKPEGQLTYKEIFDRKREGKNMLKSDHQPTHKSLLEGHAIMRSWFSKHQTDDVQRSIMLENFRTNPSMKSVLADFIDARIHELPPLTIASPDGEYRMPWQTQTVYKFILLKRHEFKKNQKRKLSTTTALETDPDRRKMHHSDDVPETASEEAPVACDSSKESTILNQDQEPQQENQFCGTPQFQPVRFEHENDPHDGCGEGPSNIGPGATVSTEETAAQFESDEEFLDFLNAGPRKEAGPVDPESIPESLELSDYSIKETPLFERESYCQEEQDRDRKKTYSDYSSSEE
ncbi:hypothetical protein R1sor_016818 [Riccia sorocarpa]|uniref:Uncharacterized protein n=1 Tax=Riccia sorocarpa TaxID=122646 RepID=A0ABD3HJE7_9MARC